MVSYLLITACLMAEEKTFQGDWYTNCGVMIIKNQGNYIEGTYGSDGGHFTGLFSEDGKTLSGNWFDPPTFGPGFNAGKFSITLSEDGNSFTGSAWRGFEDNIRKLFGTRVTDTSDNFSGIWDTDRGILIMKAEGNHITGNYEDKDGKIEGIISLDGKTVEGVWSQKPTYKPPKDSGIFIFHFSDDSFTCEQWIGEKEGDPDNKWKGKRFEE